MVHILTNGMCFSCGQPLGGCDIMKYGPYSVDLEGCMGFYKNVEIPLAPKQLLLFSLLIQKQGEILPHWQAEHNLELKKHPNPRNVLKVHYFKLRQILGENAIELIWGVGYKLVLPKG
mgnify:CR=1 FL=1